MVQSARPGVLEGRRALADPGPWVRGWSLMKLSLASSSLLLGFSPTLSWFSPYLCGCSSAPFADLSIFAWPLNVESLAVSAVGQLFPLRGLSSRELIWAQALSEHLCLVDDSWTCILNSEFTFFWAADLIASGLLTVSFQMPQSSLQPPWPTPSSAYHRHPFSPCRLELQELCSPFRSPSSPSHFFGFVFLRGEKKKKERDLKIGSPKKGNRY